MKCPTCESCDYAKYCGATEIMRKCDRHNKKVDMTNEEWFDSLSTEEKAKFFDSNGMKYCVCGCKECIIAEQCKSGGIRKTHEEMWVNWLKAVHKE